jgi:hypothetical protein
MPEKYCGWIVELSPELQMFFSWVPDPSAKNFCKCNLIKLLDIYIYNPFAVAVRHNVS